MQKSWKESDCFHEILESDRKVHRKQRHTAQRIFDRLRDEHDYTGGVTIVKEAVFCLDGRQHLKVVRIPQANVAAYQSLISGG